MIACYSQLIYFEFRTNKQNLAEFALSLSDKDAIDVPVPERYKGQAMSRRVNKVNQTSYKDLNGDSILDVMDSEANSHGFLGRYILFNNSWIPVRNYKAKTPKAETSLDGKTTYTFENDKWVISREIKI